MTRERLGILLDKYHNEQCSEGELRELEAFYNTIGIDEAELPGEITRNWGQFAEQEYQELKGKMLANRSNTRHRWLVLYKIAAICLLVLGLGAGIIYYVKHSLSPVIPLPEALSYNAVGQSDAQSRYLKLPDSSVVILHAGSLLQMYDSSFTGNTREVALTGTAYFDIHHMPKKPFVIHAGIIKITVLGTAFNIKESGDSVSVTVTRGKVKVEDGHKVLAILTSNQQIVYTPQKQQVARDAKAGEAIKWIKSGLLFNDERMDSIVQQLKTRYNVQIRFANKEVKKCRVTINNAFNGTEPLDEILAFICPAVNASFKVTNDGIVIDGPGCNE